ncbi:hypothetical protein BHM03_00054515, partial [Ensete ventricosum]
MSHAEPSFDRFYVHRLENSKYWPLPTYLPMVSRTSMVSRTKRDGRKLCAESSFDRFFVHRLGNSKYWSLTLREVTVEFRSIFHAPSRKFKILVIPDVLAHGKSYEHGFTNKLDGHILCVNHAH